MCLDTAKIIRHIPRAARKQEPGQTDFDFPTENGYRRTLYSPFFEILNFVSFATFCSVRLDSDLIT